MPRSSQIIPRKVGNRYRVIIPIDLRKSAKRETRSFSSEAKAYSFCKLLLETRGEFGSLLLQLGKLDQSRMVEALEVAGDSQSVLDAVRFWRGQKPKEEVTLKGLAVLAVADREKRNRSKKHCKELAWVLRRFIATAGEATLAHAVQPHTVEKFFDAHPEWGQHTRRNYLRYIRAMFAFGVKKKMLAANPALEIELDELLEGPPRVFTVDEAERWMRAGERVDPKLVQFMALCLFGGCRVAEKSEAWRVQKEDIVDGEIVVEQKRTRTRKNRTITINPTLKAWLDRYPGDFSPSNLRKRLKKVRDACNPPIEWAQSITRHTFVSCHYKVHGGKVTAMEAGHDEDVMHARYRALFSQDDAERFWCILPAPLPPDLRGRQ